VIFFRLAAAISFTTGATTDFLFGLYHYCLSYNGIGKWLVLETKAKHFIQRGIKYFYANLLCPPQFSLRIYEAVPCLLIYFLKYIFQGGILKRNSYALTIVATMRLERG